MPSVISAAALAWPLTLPPDCDPDGPVGIDPEQWEAAQASAAAWLWALSGRQFGEWTVTWRPEWTVPVAQSIAPGLADYGRWYGQAGLMWGYGACLKPRPAGLPSTVTILPGPVVSVTSVRIDGAILDPVEYRMVGDQLQRLDGIPWPVSQDTTKPTTAAGTWEIVYTRGRLVPLGGQIAAGALACEIAKAMLGEDCDLPSNVTSVSRNGVTITMDSKEITAGYTGIQTVDQWVRTVNPARLTREPTVWTPDLDPTLLSSP